MAVNASEVYAWRLFTYLNWPAKTAGGLRGVPNDKLPMEVDACRVWETWKFADEVFLADGKRPAAWSSDFKDCDFAEHQEPPKAEIMLGATPGFKFEGRQIIPKTTKAINMLNALRPHPAEASSETAMNQASYTFILDESLYSVKQQERYYAANQAVDFPKDAILVKASWRLIDDLPQAKQDLYYVKADNNGRRFGLVGFHITTKDIPNWFWCSFEHKGNRPPAVPDQSFPRLDSHPDFSNEFVNVDPQGRKVYRRVPAAVTGLWRNYRLRGVQTSFTDSMGEPSILGNTTMEGEMEGTSSCISCHARASIGQPVQSQGEIDKDSEGVMIRFFGPIPSNRLSPQKNSWYGATNVKSGFVGPPNPRLFTSTTLDGSRAYLPLDFVWSLWRAK